MKTLLGVIALSLLLFPNEAVALNAEAWEKIRVWDTPETIELHVISCLKGNRLNDGIIDKAVCRMVEESKSKCDATGADDDLVKKCIATSVGSKIVPNAKGEIQINTGDLDYGISKIAIGKDKENFYHVVFELEKNNITLSQISDRYGFANIKFGTTEKFEKYAVLDGSRSAYLPMSVGMSIMFGYKGRILFLFNNDDTLSVVAKFWKDYPDTQKKIKKK